MDDRFSFGAELEEEPIEDERGGSRLPLIAAIGLIGTMVIGLLLGGMYYLVIRPRQQEQEAQRATKVVAEITAIAQETELAPTDTPVPTATPVPTDTPVPTPTPKATNTPVIQVPATPEPGAAPTPTRTPIGGTQTPQTGIGGLGAALAAVGLLAVILVARKLRLAS